MKRVAELNNKQNPLVTINIQSHNEGEYIDNCLNSVLNQTYQNIEICLYDCASTDDTWSIGLKYQEQYPGIITLINLRKDYFPNGINYSMVNVHGKYFINMNANSFLSHICVERCVGLLESYPSAAFAMFNRIEIDDDGNEIKKEHIYNESCLIPGETHIPYIFCGVQPENISFAMFNSDMVKCDGINEFRLIELQLCLKYQMIYIKEYLYYYREKEKNKLPGVYRKISPIISRLRNQFVMANELFTVHNIEGMESILLASMEKLSQFYTSECIHFLKQDSLEYALKLLLLAFVINPQFDDNVLSIIKKIFEQDILPPKLDFLNKIENFRNLNQQFPNPPPKEAIIIS